MQWQPVAASAWLLGAQVQMQVLLHAIHTSPVHATEEVRSRAFHPTGRRPQTVFRDCCRCRVEWLCRCARCATSKRSQRCSVHLSRRSWLLCGWYIGWKQWLGLLLLGHRHRNPPCRRRAGLLSCRAVPVPSGPVPPVVPAGLAHVRASRWQGLHMSARALQHLRPCLWSNHVPPP